MDTVYVPVSGKSILATRISELFVKGENIPERVVFQINGQTPEFCYLMYKRIGDASPYIITLEKSYAEGVTNLLWKPSIHFCAKQGAVEIQLIACDISDPSAVEGEEVVRLTKIATVEIADAFVDPDNPEPLDSIFTEYLTRFEGLLGDTEEARDEAKGYADDAKESADDAKEYAEQAEEALSSLEERVTILEGKVEELETPAVITDEEIDDIFEES